MVTKVDFAASEIMMVDDEPTTLDVMEMFLREEGFERFAKITEARRALERIRAKRPDLLLLNLVMPDLDGFDVLEHMRADPSLRGVLVILVTSSTDPETKQRAMALGASDFLGKPVDRSELILRVRNTLAAKAWRDGAGVGRAAEAPPLVSRLDIGDPHCRAILERFAARLEEKLVAMDQCHEAGDLQGLRTIGHGLKGAAGTVGFDAFTQPAETLRMLAQEGKKEELGPAIAVIRDMAGRMVVPDSSDETAQGKK